VVIVVVIAVLFVMTVTVLGMDDHFVVVAVLCVVMRLVGLGVNPAG